MSRILLTRGIQGVLLPPQEHLTKIDLAWDKLSAVTFGYTLAHPRLHLVSNHEYRTMGTLFAELEKRDYQRVGLVNLREHDKRVDNNWLAAYLVEQTRLQPEHQMPPLVLEQWNTKTFLSWVEHYRPDAIVTQASGGSSQSQACWLRRPGGYRGRLPHVWMKRVIACRG